MEIYFACDKQNNNKIELLKRFNISSINSNEIDKLINQTILIYENIQEKLNKKHINILLLSSPIIDTTNIGLYNYYLPTSPQLFLNHVSTLGYKLLLPINLFNQKGNKARNYKKKLLKQNMFLSLG